MSAAGRVLVVDDEEGIRTFVAEALEAAGHDVTQAADGAAALLLAKEEPFDVVITDLRMPGVDGMTLVRTLRTEQPDVEVVVLTAFGDVTTAVAAMKLGALDYLEKPVSSLGALRELVARAIERRTRIARGAAFNPSDAQGAPLTWGAPSMRPVIDALGRVARTGATVLLLGETGAGKEVFARAIHARSARADKPFVAINCAALSENLLESELFGHEKGAFTGAHAQRRGRVELADKGTFFLDEVGELKPHLQAKLLRVLEERRFERVGGTQPLSVDVRWIAATHRDLRAMIPSGAFREDLYHRLAVFPLTLPPLRERREDLVPLAEALLVDLARAAGRPAPRLDDALKQWIRSGRVARQRAGAQERAGARAHPRRRAGAPHRAPVAGGEAGLRCHGPREHGHPGGRGASGHRARARSGGREPARRGGEAGDRPAYALRQTEALRPALKRPPVRAVSATRRCEVRSAGG